MIMIDDNSCLITSFYSFQDEKYLHLVMEYCHYCEGGDSNKGRDFFTPCYQPLRVHIDNFVFSISYNL